MTYQDIARACRRIQQLSAAQMLNSPYAVGLCAFIDEIMQTLQYPIELWDPSPISGVDAVANALDKRNRRILYVTMGIRIDADSSPVQVRIGITAPSNNVPNAWAIVDRHERILGHFLLQESAVGVNAQLTPELHAASIKYITNALTDAAAIVDTGSATST